VGTNSSRAEFVRIATQLERKRKGGVHFHEFKLVESCDCCGTQMLLFEGFLADAPAVPPLAEDVSRETSQGD
jgi:hypothetical protein